MKLLGAFFGWDFFSLLKNFEGNFKTQQCRLGLAGLYD